MKFAEIIIKYGFFLLKANVGFIHGIFLATFFFINTNCQISVNQTNMDSSPSEKSEKPYFSNENDMKKTCVSASRTMSGNSHNIVHKLFHREVSPSKINLGLFTRLNTLFFLHSF